MAKKVDYEILNVYGHIKKLFDNETFHDVFLWIEDTQLKDLDNYGKTNRLATVGDPKVMLKRGRISIRGYDPDTGIADEVIYHEEVDFGNNKAGDRKANVQIAKNIIQALDSGWGRLPKLPKYVQKAKFRDVKGDWAHVTKTYTLAEWLSPGGPGSLEKPLPPPRWMPDRNDEIWLASFPEVQTVEDAEKAEDVFVELRIAAWKRYVRLPADPHNLPADYEWPRPPGGFVESSNSHEAAYLKSYFDDINQEITINSWRSFQLEELLKLANVLKNIDDKVVSEEFIKSIEQSIREVRTANVFDAVMHGKIPFKSLVDQDFMQMEYTKDFLRIPERQILRNVLLMDQFRYMLATTKDLIEWDLVPVEMQKAVGGNNPSKWPTYFKKILCVRLASGKIRYLRTDVRVALGPPIKWPQDVKDGIRRAVAKGLIKWENIPSNIREVLGARPKRSFYGEMKVDPTVDQVLIRKIDERLAEIEKMKAVCSGERPEEIIDDIVDDNFNERNLDKDPPFSPQKRRRLYAERECLFNQLKILNGSEVDPAKANDVHAQIDRIQTRIRHINQEFFEEDYAPLLKMRPQPEQAVQSQNLNAEVQETWREMLEKEDDICAQEMDEAEKKYGFNTDEYLEEIIKINERLKKRNTIKLAESLPFMEKLIQQHEKVSNPSPLPPTPKPPVPVVPVDDIHASLRAICSKLSKEGECGTCADEVRDYLKGKNKKFTVVLLHIKNASLIAPNGNPTSLDHVKTKGGGVLHVLVVYDGVVYDNVTAGNYRVLEYFEGSLVTGAKRNTLIEYLKSNPTQSFYATWDGQTKTSADLSLSGTVDVRQFLNSVTRNARYVSVLEEIELEMKILRRELHNAEHAQKILEKAVKEGSPEEVQRAIARLEIVRRQAAGLRNEMKELAAELKEAQEELQKDQKLLQQREVLQGQLNEVELNIEGIEQALADSKTEVERQLFRQQLSAAKQEVGRLQGEMAAAVPQNLLPTRPKLAIPNVQGDPLEFDFTSLNKKQLTNAVKYLGDVLFENLQSRNFQNEELLNTLLVRAQAALAKQAGKVAVDWRIPFVLNSGKYKEYLILRIRLENSEKAVKILESQAGKVTDPNAAKLNKATLKARKKESSLLKSKIKDIESQIAVGGPLKAPKFKQYTFSFGKGQTVAIYNKERRIYSLFKATDAGKVPTNGPPIAIVGNVNSDMAVRSLRWQVSTEGGTKPYKLGAKLLDAYETVNAPHLAGVMLGFAAGINHLALMKSQFDRTYKPGDQGPIPSWFINGAFVASLVRTGEAGTGLFGALKASVRGVKAPAVCMVATVGVNRFFPVSEANPWGNLVDGSVALLSFTPAAIVAIPVGLVVKVGISLNEQKERKLKADFARGTEYLSDLCAVRRERVFAPREAAALKEMQTMLDKGQIIKHNSPEWKKFFGVQYLGDGGHDMQAKYNRWNVREDYGALLFPTPKDEMEVTANDQTLDKEPQMYDNYMTGSNWRWNIELHETWNGKRGILATLASLEELLRVYGHCIEARNQLYSLMYNVASRARLLSAVNFWTYMASRYYTRPAVLKAPSSIPNTLKYPSIIQWNNDNDLHDAINQIYLNDLAGDWVVLPFGTNLLQLTQEKAKIIFRGNFYHHMQKQIAVDAKMFCHSIQLSLKQPLKPSLKQIYDGVLKVSKINNTDDIIVQSITNQNKIDPSKQLIVFNLESALKEFCDEDKKSRFYSEVEAEAKLKSLNEAKKAAEERAVKNAALFNKWLSDTPEGRLFNIYDVAVSKKIKGYNEQLQLVCADPSRFCATVYGQSQNSNQLTAEHQNQVSVLKAKIGEYNAIKLAMENVRSVVYSNIMYPLRNPPITVGMIVKVVNLAKAALGEQPLTDLETKQLVASVDYKGDENTTQLMQKVDQEMVKQEQKENFDKWSALSSLRATLKTINTMVVMCMQANEGVPAVDIAGYQQEFAQIVGQDKVAKKDTRTNHGPPPPPPGLSSSATSCDPKCVKPSDLFTTDDEPKRKHQHKTQTCNVEKFIEDMFS